MKFQFAHNQHLMSKSHARYPILGKIVNHLFGTTNVGQYARANLFQKILNELPHHKFQHVLDLGCGQGEYAFMMANAFKKTQITALDIEKERIRSINEIIGFQHISNLSTHLGGCDTLPKDNQFDFIYSIDVFEHIEEDEMPFADAYLRLKENGLLLVKMPSRDQVKVLPRKWFAKHEEWLNKEHIGQIYMLEDLENRMKKEGFEIVYSSYGDGMISRLSWELGYLSRKGGPIIQLLLLPFLKALVLLDRTTFSSTKGNSIQVIGKKVKS